MAAHIKEAIAEQLGLPGLVRINMETDLLEEEYTKFAFIICGNSIDRHDLWDSGNAEFLNTIVNPDAPFSNRLAQLCSAAKVRRCQRDICSRMRERMMDSIAPRCQWSPFRDWAVTAMACQALFTPAERKRRRAFTHLVMAATLCHRLLADYAGEDSKQLDGILVGKRGERYETDLTGVAEVIYWMLTIQNANGTGHILEGKWGPRFLPRDFVRTGVITSMTAAEDLGLCMNRLWNLMAVMERREVDLPGLLEQATSHHPSRFTQKGHKKCRPRKCPFNTLDTSKMKQLHKIAHCRCRQMVYPVSMIEKSISKGTGSVWSRHEIKPLTGVGVRYAAISHVWMDGTGIGIGKRAGIGIVNKCLSDFFLRIAQRLNCDGIWWDTISLPTNDALRKKCIDNMHENYRAAECTILHDNFLLNFEWSEDGSPCVAIVLSSWFTRGWTALELHESKRVKVLFKGPDPNNPLIKDLDDDILAKHPATAPRAHWIATRIIQRMRRRSASRGWDRPIDNMRDLLAIIQPRSVCRIEDKTTIAGLLADLAPMTDCDDCSSVPTNDASRAVIKDHIKHHTTERVLKRLPRLGHASLLHGKPTLRESGAFSWAPAAIYDMPVETAGELEDSARTDFLMSVDADGGVTGSWHYRGVSAEECREKGAITPLDGSDTATVARVQCALQQNRLACVLLREGRITKPWLLVMTVGGGRGQRCRSSLEEEGRGEVGDVVVDCRYVGAVKVSWLYEKATAAADWGRYGRATFRLGHDEGRPVVDAGYVLPQIMEGCLHDSLFDSAAGDGRGEEKREGEENGGVEDMYKEEEEDEESAKDADRKERDGDKDKDDAEEIPSDEEVGWFSSDEEGPAKPKWY
ncbi:hypothetical protein CDV36_000235 [Fusarium kuroshium]|uniref:Heterokaryon incompatibility domain-containing protein n=1 Tax=Fusarium kuroshium TaxID=2010991 RepID=A0A3M2SS29_9HYPO|nr:hypothetical protein CDV36_000235 [Fusarium kuroshium]